MAKRKRGNGEGTIFKLGDGRWRAAITIGKKPDGTLIRKVFSARARREVQGQLADALKDLRMGMLVAPRKQTVGQFLHWWLNEVVRTSARPKTLKFYEFVSRVHLIPAFGNLPVQRLTAQHVQRMLSDCSTVLSARTGRPLSKRSIRHIHRTLCTALNSAVNYKAVGVNVALDADPPKNDPKKDKSGVRYFTVEQARKFLEVATADRLHALFATVLSLGLRLGEALGVAWPDVDLDAGSFNIHQALQRIDKKLFPEKGGLQLVDPKGGYSDRMVKLPAVAISALARHRAQQETERAWAGSHWRNDWDLVFTSTAGRPMDERNVLRRFQALLAIAGLPRMRIHDLRHSAVAILIAQGLNVKAISELLGHSSVAFTLKVYGHLFEQAKQETADKMDAALAPVPAATTVATKTTPERVN
jgi:integrase